MCDEEKSINKYLNQGQCWETAMLDWLRGLGRIDSYRETSKALMKFLLWLDFYISLYVYLEEQAGERDSVYLTAGSMTT